MEGLRGVLNHDEVLAVVALNNLSDLRKNSEDFLIAKVYSYCPPSIKIFLDTMLNELIVFIQENNYRHELAISKVNELVCNQSKTCIMAKDNLFQIEAVLKSVVVYHSYYNKTNGESNRLNGENNLLNDYNQYSEFANSNTIDSTEVEYMSNFRHAMQAALRIIPAEKNKRLLLTICAYLEGSGRNYSTGGTQSLATSRRVRIYEHESEYLKQYYQQESPHEKEKQKQKQRQKTLTTCQCGAVILQRTMWKHRKSKRHKTFLHCLINASASPCMDQHSC